jgi:cobalamin biosynthesis protein CobT
MEGHLTKIARAMSRNWDVNVVFTGSSCMTDGKSTVYLPYNSDYLGEDAKVLIHGNLDHEVCHVSEEQKAMADKRPTPIGMMKAIRKPSLKLLWNVFEDIRIERVYSREFPGMAENLRAGSRHSVRLFKQRHKRDESGTNFWHNLGCGIIANSQAWDDLSWIPAEINEWLELVNDEIVESRKAETPEEAMALAKRVYEKTLKKADEAKDAEAKAKAKGKGDSGEGHHGSGGGSGPATGEPASPSTRDHRKPFDPIVEPTITDLMDLVKDEIAKASVDDAKVNKRYIPAPDCKALDRWFKPGLVGNMGDYNEALEEVRSQISTLRAKTLSLVRVMATSRTVGDQSEGALDAASLHTLKTGNKNVFSTEVPGQVISTAVSVLIDLSGSMLTKAYPKSKCWYAHRTAIALAETFEQLRVPCEFIGFTNSYARMPRTHIPPNSPYQHREPFDYSIFKDFNESLRNTRYRFQHIEGSADNADGEAVWEVAKRLARRPEQRKLLIVISDGEPACSTCDYGMLSRHLKLVVKDVTKAGIEVFGIGVLTSSVKQFYNPDTGSESIVINSLDQMSVQVYTAMRKKLLRRAA